MSEHHFNPPTGFAADLFQLGSEGMRDFQNFHRPSLPEPDKNRLAAIAQEIITEGRHPINPHRRNDL